MSLKYSEILKSKQSKQKNKESEQSEQKNKEMNEIMEIQEMQNKIKSLKENLQITKSKLDNIPYINIITNALDPFRREKYNISQNIGEDNISNAWLKCFSIITRFQLLHNKPYIRHYDNASFPGAFILATEYIIKTYYNQCDYQWRACSLYDPLQPHLNDDYKLYEQYPEKWLMDSENNGDVTKLENLNNIAAKLQNKTNFYTSDLGFDVSSDYNNQERLHFAANTGQILLCLKVLQERGCCIIKHYTYLEDYTLKYLSEFSKLFQKFYFYKPSTSKALNSEIYLVGINFRKRNELKETYQTLVSQLENSLVYKDYNLDYYKFPLDFIKSIWPMTTNTVCRQINELNKVVAISQTVDYQAYNVKKEILSVAKKFRGVPLITYNDAKDKLVNLSLK